VFTTSGWNGVSNAVRPSVESLEEELKWLKKLCLSERARHDAVTPVIAEIESLCPGALRTHSLKELGTCCVFLAPALAMRRYQKNPVGAGRGGVHLRVQDHSSRAEGRHKALLGSHAAAGETR
jgi:hypothetical protein